MSGWTVTFDASPEGKAKRSGVGGWVRHIARDIDEANGCQVQHSNENIVPERTHLNETLMWTDDGWVKPESTRQIIDLINAKIDEAVEARRAAGFTGLHKNAVVLRGLVLQLDPKWIEENNPDWRVNGLNERTRELHEVMVDFVMDEFKGALIPVRSTHMDETTVQIQAGLMPIRADGALDQKFYFKGPAHMKALHEKLRARLREHGYEASFSVSKRSTEHLNSAEYGRVMDKTREVEAAAEADRAVAAQARRDAETDRLAAADELRQVKLRESEIEHRERAVASREAELSFNEDAVDHRLEQIRLRDIEQEKRRVEMEEAEADRQREFDELMVDAYATRLRIFDMLDEVQRLRDFVQRKTTALREFITGHSLTAEQRDRSREAIKMADEIHMKSASKASALEAELRSYSLKR